MCGPQSTATASALLIVSGGLDCKSDVICPHWPLLNNCLGHICYVCVCVVDVMSYYFGRVVVL